MASVLENLSQVSSIPRYFGLCPLAFNKNGFYLSKPLLLLSITCCSVCISTFAYNCFSVRSEEETTSWPLLPLQGLFLSLANFITLLSLCRVSFLNRFQKKVSTVDAYFKRFGVDSEFPRTLFNGLGIVFTIIVLFVVKVSICWNNYNVLVRSFLTYWGALNMALNLYQIGGFLAVLSCRTKALLLLLKKSSGHKKLEDLVKCHCLLTRSADYLGYAMSMFFLSSSFFAFAHIVVDLFTVYKAVVSLFPNYGIIALKIVWMIFSGAMYHSLMLDIIQITHDVREFNRLLYQMMIEDKTFNLYANKMLRLTISMKREVVFSACGFFTVDHKLVHSMMGGAATYLVILIQFGPLP